MENSTLIGVVGFKGRPHNETVELGYCILNEFQRQGYCFEAVQALINWVFKTQEVSSAETFPHLTPSIRIMEKCGMIFDGAGSGTIKYKINNKFSISNG